jgi:hypothetical protein
MRVRHEMPEFPEEPRLEEVVYETPEPEVDPVVMSIPLDAPWRVWPVWKPVRGVA